jgi:uncharacterized protein (TIGR02246 family)
MAGLVTPIPVNARTMTKPVACRTISKDQVIALFDQWNKALATKKTEAVVATYAPDATLLPTVQDGPLIGREMIGKYFTYFLKQSPNAVVTARVIKTGCNIAYDIGLYTFTLDGDQPGSHKLVNARFTFIYALEHKKWLIAHHHSSAFPEAPG